MQAATEKMIEDGWISTDQQVIYTVYNTMKPRTKLQVYLPDGRSDPWFHLGYLSRDAGAKKLDLVHMPETVNVFRVRPPTPKLLRSTPFPINQSINQSISYIETLRPESRISNDMHFIMQLK